MSKSTSNDGASGDGGAQSCCCACEVTADPSPAQPCCTPQVEAKPYRYGRTPWVTGTVESGTGAVPVAAARLSLADRLGTWRVRWNIGRMHYRVAPGLYAIGSPTEDSPVLVTANFKLTFDFLRRELAEVAAWLLVLDTRGVNVWCAAGKGTFSTDEVVKRVEEAKLSQVVKHRRLILPQLGATGVARHLVRERCGFSVVYGPVRAADVPAFLAQGAKATADMRAVRFPLRDRLVLIPIEASMAWKWQMILGVLVVAFVAGLGGGHAFDAAAYGVRVGVVYGLALLPIVGGAVLVPAALPLVPAKAFSTKGALVGAILAAAVVAGLHTVLPPLALAGVFLAVTAASSYVAMNFTGSTTFTSPSGVEKEMRRALPFQVGGGLVAVLLLVAQFVLQLVGVTI